MEIVLHYYHFNIGDYRKDTVHLSRLEHSIYRDLIDWYYLDEAPIPLETQSVARRLRLVTQEEKDALLAVLKDFFDESDDGWRHKRIDQDIKDYNATCERNRLNGMKGGRPKNPVGFQSEPSCNPNQEPITIIQEPYKDNSDFSDAGASPRRQSIPYEEIVNLYHELLPKNPRIHSLTTKRKAQIRARWLDGSLPDLDTWAQYFKFVSESNFLTGMVMPKDGRKPFAPNLEWLTNETNFTNVAEKKYHG